MSQDPRVIALADEHDAEQARREAAEEVRWTAERLAEMAKAAAALRRARDEG